METKGNIAKKYTKAQFWKCALQINPSSYIKYRGTDHNLSEDEYNAQLLQVCQEEGIKIIGIADHGNVDGIDKIRDLFTQHDILVFPGFEICTTEKVHFVCLFPEGTSKDQLDRYLGALGLMNPLNGVWPSHLGGSNLLAKVDDLGGFCFAAHVTDDKGILKQQLNHVWQDPLLKAAQIPSSLNDLRNGEGNGYRLILQNKDPEYHRETPVAIINAKDVEKPETLKDPRASCLIKMTRPSFEAFTLAFQDPESRVRLNSDISKQYYSKIESMTVTNGYLHGISIDFSDHLNAVIGGRGTGKSTLLECIRYALELEPIGMNAQKQYKEIIKENIGKEKARIELGIRSSKMNGKKFTISRKYPDEAFVKDEEGNISSFKPADLLPEIEIYGQNEIFEIAQDSNAQRRLLSRFLEDGYGEREWKIQESLKALGDNRVRLVAAMNAIAATEEELIRLPRLEEQVKQYIALGIEDKLKIIPLLEKEKRLKERIQEEELKSVKDAVERVQGVLPDTVFLSEKALETLPHKEILEAIKIELDSIAAKTEEFIRTWQSKMNPHFQKIENLLSELTNSMDGEEKALEKTFNELPANEGKSGRAIGLEFQRLLTEIERIQPKKVLAETQGAVVAALRKQRRAILSDLSEQRALRSAHFIGSLKKIQNKLKGNLKLKVLPEADRTPLVKYLMSCNLEGVGENRLSWIYKTDELTPSMLVERIQSGVDALLNAGWGITPSTANALVKMSNKEILGMEELELPDIIKIELNIAHGDQELYKPIENLSRGQQCTAILHLLLLQNKDPLIVDQPEDNLDNAFIAERIVAELRSEKVHRQFLFATHNANIPVFGDAEWIGILEVQDNRGFMPNESQGAIDVSVIRDKTASILEGGKTAFNQRKEKYKF
ncbi:TrlF family AAA-like ATPase [uncultured Sphaerochaeta sp.]|uniref:TrlF family AAA-like ATPase n=1 Tax=uncultured Sphaerochaeta sp. TaxID=886478 RepID=UPI0029CA3157|nr:AAA family ATPase [uncultured Sphaerochaeta sp.]